VIARERNAQVALAESLGVLPTTPIDVEDLSKVEMPKELEPSIEGVINRALEQRPDLLAKVALVREKEAALRRTRKSFYPTLTLSANSGYSATAIGIKVDQSSFPWFAASGPAYGAKVALSWMIFDGGARRRAVELAEAGLRAAEAETEEARDLAISEVWRAYTNAKLAIRRLESPPRSSTQARKRTTHSSSHTRWALEL